MAKFKSRQELEELKESVSTEDNVIAISPKKQAQQLDLFMPDLKKLKLHELENRLVDLDWQYADRQDVLNRQYMIIKWRICMLIRDKFDSDKLFGQHMIEFREKNPTHPLSVCSQQTFNKWVNAARFCEEHRITDLNTVKLYPESIYALSAPRHKEIAEEVYKEVRKKNMSAADVKRLIEQRMSVFTIEKQQPAQEPEKIDYSGSESPELRHIEVSKGIAQTPEVLAQESEKKAQKEHFHKPVLGELLQAVKETLFHHQATVETHDDEELAEYHEQEKLDDPHRKEMLHIMSQMDASMIDDNEIVNELMIFMQQYRRTGLKLIPLFQSAIDRARPNVYPRR
jgi:hypothetical protein